MQFPSNNNPVPHSPTLSDGSKAKRGYAAVNKSNNKDKIQKMRRLDSPTSPTDRNFVQVPSPQYSTLDSGKFSPKTGQDKNQISPKGLYPPSIQKYLNRKANISIRDAVDKLKSPTNKTHKTNLEKMQLLGMLQTQEIETNIMFRKAYSNSTSVSPARSNSPIESPKMTISPKVEPSSPTDNIVMTFEESSPTMGTAFQNQSNNNWNNNRIGNNNMMNQPYNQAQQQGFYNNNPQGQMGFNNQNFQGNQGNFSNNQQGFHGMQQQQQYNQQGGQFNSFNQQQPAYYNNNNNNNNNNQGQQGNHFVEEEPRERTTSFLMDAGNFGNFGNLGMMNQGGSGGGNGLPDTKWMAQNQINQIQTLVQTKKTISPGEPSRGIAQLFQKRNSNPENIMRNGGPQPLFPQKNQSTGMNAFQGFNNNNNNNNNGNNNNNQMFQSNNSQGNNNLFNSGYQPQVSSHQLQQKLFETGMVEQHGGGYNNNNNNNNNNQMGMNQGMNMYQNNPMGQSSNLGEINFEFRFAEENNPAWSMNNPFGHDDKIHEKIEENDFVLDPSAFLGLKESIDFDMNIIPSNVGFMPGENNFDGLDNQIKFQDSTGTAMDNFLNSNQF